MENGELMLISISFSYKKGKNFKVIFDGIFLPSKITLKI